MCCARYPLCPTLLLLTAFLMPATCAAQVRLQGDESGPDVSTRHAEIRQTTTKESCRAYTQAMSNIFNLSGDNLSPNSGRSTTSGNQRLLVEQVRSINPFADMRGAIGEYLRSSYVAIRDSVSPDERPNLDGFYQDCLAKLPRLMQMDDNAFSSEPGVNPTTHSDANGRVRPKQSGTHHSIQDDRSTLFDRR